MKTIETAIADAIKREIHTHTTKSNEELEILTPSEAVDFFGREISYSTIMRECRNGNIPHFKIGNRVYFRKEKLMEWIELQEQR